jgi:hypothetical protein
MTSPPQNCRCRNLCHLAGCFAGHWLPGPAAGRAWDDLRLVGLRLLFLIVTRAVSLPGLSRREEWWKDAEILMPRHQLAVAKRERPRAHSRLTWPDRAWLALLAATVPAERLAAMRLIVTPGTILRWHENIVRRRWARLSCQGRSGRPTAHRNVRSVVLRLARENESWGSPLAHLLPADRAAAEAMTAFLNEACQRGVLRQVGAVYQFRHFIAGPPWLFARSGAMRRPAETAGRSHTAARHIRDSAPPAR